MLNFRLLTTALSTCLILSTAAIAQTPAPAIDENTPVTRAQLPALIKETLIKDPSILMDAAKSMRSAQRDELVKKVKDGISKYKTDLFSDPATPSIGATDADVTVIEFFDYHCGYCKQALASISKLLENDKKVRVVFREYPILSEDSKFASRAALAVNRIAKDKYFEFHKAMFNTTGSIDEAFVSAEAKKLGIDAEKLKKEMTNPAIDAMLAKNKEIGMEIGAEGTPAIIIGEKFFPGVMSYEIMQKEVDDVRAGNKKPK